MHEADVMDIKGRISRATNLTPIEQQLAACVMELDDRLQGYTLKELASYANVSVPSVHRFCKKLGLEGFKQLKVELARSASQNARHANPVNIDFPFEAGDDPGTIFEHMASVYDTTLHDTQSLVNFTEMDRAALLLANADVIDIYTQSHNLYTAHMFCDRLLSIGKNVLCSENGERQIRRALASGPGHVALAISYSGLAPSLVQLLPLLKKRGVPIVYIGTPRGARINPGLDVYLHVSDRESLQNRLTQFASHIAVQYVLDVLFGCIFTRTAGQSRAFWEESLPYTALPALRNPAGPSGAQPNHSQQ